MKTEILAAYDAAQTSFAALKSLLDTMPNDPAAPAPAPTGLRVIGATGENPRTYFLAWDFDYPSTPALLEMKGAEGNPAGPTEWTEQPYNGTGPDGVGTMFAFVQQNPAGQVFLFRVRYQNADGIYGDACEITVNADDYLPAK